jgi:2-keto-3-deoxy-L-rhamnonate aldolase RhmA
MDVYPLSANLRLEGAENQEAFWKVMDSIQLQCMQAGVAVGTIPFAGVSVPALFNKGYQMVAAGSDITMLREGLTQLTLS